MQVRVEFFMLLQKMNLYTAIYNFYNSHVRLCMSVSKSNDAAQVRKRPSKAAQQTGMS